MNRAFKELFGRIRAEEELKERTAAFLAERTRGYSRAARRPYAIAAACACLLLVLLGGRWLCFTPTARISIDINPSIELGVNRLDRVISVDGLNEDGRELTRALDLKYRHYAQALEQILASEAVAALLSGDEVMTVTVIGPDGGQGARILSTAERCTAGRSDTRCCFAHSEEVAGAHEAGMSCGKYRAFLELRLLDPDITEETARGMTMGEIWDLIDSHHSAHEYENRHGGQGHHGHGGHW